MKIIVLLFCSLFFFSLPNEREVYLCLTKSCRGLSSCKHEITPKKQSEAEALGLTLCGWED